MNRPNLEQSTSNPLAAAYGTEELSQAYGQTTPDATANAPTGLPRRARATAWLVCALWAAGLSAGCGTATTEPGGVDSGVTDSATGNTDGAGTDGTSADGTSSDGSSSTGDTATSDAATADAATPDAATPDASTTDSGAADTTVADAGLEDDGAGDTAAPDSGMVDSGPVDAGPADSGAADAGTSSCTMGKGQCPSGSFCEAPAGTCAEYGTCSPKPMACTKIYDPVCGCDGKTYGNLCLLKSAGGSLKAKGKCPAGPGSACTAGQDSCAAGSYCQLPGGQCTGQGTCAVKPTVCASIYSPVCGCNGQTYSNTCTAQSQGRNLQSKGECPKPKSCGGKQGLTCGAGQFCEPDQCGADVLGTCVPGPKAPCPKTTPAAQVCGCDKKTYANDCLRMTAKVGKASDGPCAP